jgi:hypothetical protein
VSYDVDSFFDVTSQGARLSGLTWLYSLAKADGSSFFFQNATVGTQVVIPQESPHDYAPDPLASESYSP